MTFFLPITNFFLNKFKIPTLLGLSIIFFGIAAGVYLVLREQTFLSQATPNLTPQNITITNITEDSAVISWQTSSPAISFLSFGQQNFQEQTNLDDRDTNTPKAHLTHYVTLKNLLPKTEYQFKITSGKKLTTTLKFKTAQPVSSQTGFTPIIGSILYGDTPLTDGISYLTISGANPQSALIKLNGNFLLPISQMRKDDLSDIFPLTEDMIAKLTIVSDKGKATALFKLKASTLPLPALRLGEDIDLTNVDLGIPQATTSAQELNNRYDLNSDGKINAADNAIILQNFGPLRSEASRNPKNPKADLNGDEVVDQKDVDLMSQHINQ